MQTERQKGSVRNFLQTRNKLVPGGERRSRDRRKTEVDRISSEIRVARGAEQQAIWGGKQGGNTEAFRVGKQRLRGTHQRR